MGKAQDGFMGQLMSNNAFKPEPFCGRLHFEAGFQRISSWQSRAGRERRIREVGT
jgi:hypothetical protein